MPIRLKLPFWHSYGKVLVCTILYFWFVKSILLVWAIIKKQKSFRLKLKKTSSRKLPSRKYTMARADSACQLNH